jgi:hypothetical protein
MENFLPAENATGDKMPSLVIKRIQELIPRCAKMEAVGVWRELEQELLIANQNDHLPHLGQSVGVAHHGGSGAMCT